MHSITYTASYYIVVSSYVYVWIEMSHVYYYTVWWYFKSVNLIFPLLNTYLSASVLLLLQHHRKSWSEDFVSGLLLWSISICHYYSDCNLRIQFCKQDYRARKVQFHETSWSCETLAKEEPITFWSCITRHRVWWSTSSPKCPRVQLCPSWWAYFCESLQEWLWLSGLLSHIM